MKKSLLFFFPILIVILACNLGAPTESPLNLATLQAQATEQSDASDPHSAALTPDLLATFLASTPATAVSPLAPLQTPTSAVIPTFTSTPGSAPTSVPFPSASDGLTGHIVFTCQIYKVQASNQVCIMNADGTGFRRLTTDATRQHYYPSLSPDGASVVYAAFREENVYEIYEMNLADAAVRQLTDREGILNAPEISPDGQTITFMRWTVNSNQYQVWLMERNGDDPRNIPKVTGWDPTWSPDGKKILFASDRGGSTQLYVVNVSGGNLHQVGSLPAIRGRSDWSPDGLSIVTYSGEPWHREVYIMNADGSNVRQLSPAGGNAQGPSFSPDGQWVVFTAYYDHYGDDHGCEIYVVRVDGTDLRRLTDNDYCDYQPRWGP